MTEKGTLKKFFRMPRADGKRKIIPKIRSKITSIFIPGFQNGSLEEKNVTVLVF